jgi:hypothetical protein
MLFSNLLLTTDTIIKLEIIDINNTCYSLHDLVSEKPIATKNGQQFICIYPLSGTWENSSATHIITIKNSDETRSEIHKVLTIKDIRDIITDTLGLTLLYESNVI